MNRNTKIILLTLISFSLHYLLSKLFFADIYHYLTELVTSKNLSYVLTYLLVGIPIFLATWHLNLNNFLSSLGLQKGFLQGVVVALICTLPMLIGYAIVFEWNQEANWNKIVTGVICAAFFEELYYRGFLFGQIFRFTKIGFIPAILIGALIFASAHLYQSSDPGTLIGIFMTTFFGAGLFAWVYVEWDNNLWVPIWLHLLMNLFWLLFSAGDNALGGVYSNIFRVLTITTVIVGTIVYKKRKGKALVINRNSLWMQS